MYQGNALKQQTPTHSERLGAAVIRDTTEHSKGFAQGYANAAELAKAMTLADYLRDADAHRDLLDNAALAFEAGAISRAHLRGFWAGLADFRSDLKEWEYDPEAEARLKAAGVTL